MKAQSELMGDHKSCTEMMQPHSSSVTIMNKQYEYCEKNRLELHEALGQVGFQFHTRERTTSQACGSLSL